MKAAPKDARARKRNTQKVKIARMYHLYESDEAARDAEDAILASLPKLDDKFVDNHFQTNTALYNDWTRPPTGHPPVTEIDWRRISDMVIHGITDPKIMIEGKDEGAVVQGALSNCWFVGALAVLATRDDLLRVCFVATKNWTRGIYTLKIYKEGQWRYVHIDDRIPCSRRGTPLYVRCQNSNETWALLLEKAYAKLHLSYENLAHGWLDYALRDLTGGLTTKMQLSEDDGSLFHVLKAAKEQDSLIGAIYNPIAGALLQLSSTGIERDRDLGILMGRAYGVLRMIEVRAAAVAGAAFSDSDDEDDDEDVLQLVQLRDPWGLMQWTGRWSPNDVLWSDYPSAHKQVAPFAEARTFWMSWQDFRQQFNQVGGVCMYVCMYGCL